MFISWHFSWWARSFHGADRAYGCWHLTQFVYLGLFFSCFLSCFLTIVSTSSTNVEDRHRQSSRPARPSYVASLMCGLCRMCCCCVGGHHRNPRMCFGFCCCCCVGGHHRNPRMCFCCCCCVGGHHRNPRMCFGFCCCCCVGVIGTLGCDFVVPVAWIIQPSSTSI
jgi:hypothetical protein